MTKSILLALSSVLIHTESSAAAVQLSLAVHGDLAKGSTELGNATVIAEKIGKAGCPECVSIERKVLEAPIPGEVILDLESGIWKLSGGTQGFWAEPVTIDVVQGDPEQSAKLTYWPTAIVEGYLSVNKIDKLPEEVLLQFHPAPDAPVGSILPEGIVRCPVQEGRWHCEIPTGKTDLRIGAHGFQNHYFWGLDLPIGRTFDFGRLEIRHGSSVNGWVVSEPSEKLEGVQITLRPRLAGRPSNEEIRSRIQKMRMLATTNNRGFFHILGVPPGDYIIEASKEAFAPAIATVRVRENEEVQVNNPPLILSYPQPLEIHVDPPVSPTAGEWWLQVNRLDTSSTTIATIEEGTIPEDGMWRRETVAPGRYRVRIGKDGKDVWYSQDFELTSDMIPLFVQMPVVEVRGEIKLGNMPLAAMIEFRDLDKMTRSRLESEDDGTFEGFLPNDGHWDIYVESDELSVHRSFQEVKIKKNPVKGYAELELRIPDTSLVGVTVDGDLRPTEALITVQSLDEIVSAVRRSSDEEGRFRVVGLPQGRATVIAEKSVEGMSWYSREIEVDLVDGQERVTRLVLENERRIQGQLVARGSAVPGARIKAEPVGIFGLPIFPSTSDAQGRFQISFPRQARDILLSVFAPGFAFRILRIAATGQDRTIVLNTVGGTIVVEAPEDLELDLWSSPKIYILHSGAFEALDYLLFWATFNGQRQDEEKNRWTIPMMEAGEYSACLLHPSNRFSALYGISPDFPCATGYLSERAVLVLSLNSLSSAPP